LGEGHQSRFREFQRDGRNRRHETCVPRGVPAASLSRAVDNFYEWKKIEKGKQLYAIALAVGSLMALAGLWENWRSPSGEWIRSFAFITTRPNELCAELHDRIAGPGAKTWPAWLVEGPADPRQLKALLVRFPSGVTCRPVSPRVGSVKNNDPSLIEPVTLAI
jgi:putative SOS response-associated peptidase YedK